MMNAVNIKINFSSLRDICIWKFEPQNKLFNKSLISLSWLNELLISANLRPKGTKLTVDSDYSQQNYSSNISEIILVHDGKPTGLSYVFH